MYAMNEYKMKFLIGDIWINRIIYTKSKERAREIGDNMVKRQFMLLRSPSIQIMNCSKITNHSKIQEEELCEV